MTPTRVEQRGRGSVVTSSLREAVLRTVAYSDVFDYPLTVEEVHRYLVRVRSDPLAVEDALRSLVPEFLGTAEGFFFLSGRADLVAIRRRRAAAAARLWPLARRYARRIAELPFVRMVAVTGSLARDNTDPRGDVDYLLVVESGRLWVARAFVGLLARHAARRGVTVCANYYLSESSLSLDDRNVYTAYELAQMVPLEGAELYGRLRRANEWVHEHLPNATQPERRSEREPQKARRFRGLVERALRTPAGGWLDDLERRRKRRKSVREGRDLTEARFDPECFKGHFDRHRERTLAAYRVRLTSLGIAGGL